MKYFAILLISGLVSSFSWANSSDSICQLARSNGGGYYANHPFAKLILDTEVAEFYTFDNLIDALKFGGGDGKLKEFYSSRLESAKTQRVYARPSLQEAKSSAGTTEVLKINNSVFKNPRSSFKVKVEIRDFDDDYSGLFYLIHGYVIKDKAEYLCRVL